MELNQNDQIVQPKKYSPIIKWSLIIGIVIVINLFFNYSISLIYDAPKYENYCKQEQVIEEVNTKEDCLVKGGQWNGNVQEMKAVVPVVTAIKGYCDLQYTCRTVYEADRKIYERNVFITLVILGIILVGASFALSFNWILSVSASMGGILSIIIASIRYWSEADNWLRVIILFIALVSLIFFAVRRFRN